MKQNLPNPELMQRLGHLQTLHGGRKFFPTDRQRQLYRALLSAPCPSQQSLRDRTPTPPARRWQPTDG